MPSSNLIILLIRQDYNRCTRSIGVHGNRPILWRVIDFLLNMPAPDSLVLPMPSSGLSLLQPYLLGALPLLIDVDHSNVLTLIIGCVVFCIVDLFVVKADGAYLLIGLLCCHYLILLSIKVIIVLLLDLLSI